MFQISNKIIIFASQILTPENLCSIVISSTGWGGIEKLPIQTSQGAR